MIPMACFLIQETPGICTISVSCTQNTQLLASKTDRNLDNPTDVVAVNQHWGHATSKDLYHWDNQPIAIYPSAMDEGIFSGSVVIDVNNTFGFFPDQTNGVVAIYTLNTPYEESGYRLFHRRRLHFHQVFWKRSHQHQLDSVP